MAGSITKIQLIWSNGSTAELKTQENNLLLQFFSFIDLNKSDVEEDTNLKERMYELALDSLRVTFQSVD